MAFMLLCRGALRRNAVPLGVGFTSGLVLLHRQPPMRFDSALATSTSQRQFSNGPKSSHRRDRLSPEVIKQLSSGSLSGNAAQYISKELNSAYIPIIGFLSGLLVSVFSKTLVLLIGIGIVFIQVMYEIDRPCSLTNCSHAQGCRTLRHQRGGPRSAEEAHPGLPNSRCTAVQSHVQNCVWRDFCPLSLHVFLKAGSVPPVQPYQ